MIVNYNGLSYTRDGVSGQLIRNGDFIDIYWSQGKGNNWIAVSINDLRRALEILDKHGKSMFANMEKDQPNNTKTALYDLLQNPIIQDDLGIMIKDQDHSPLINIKGDKIA